MTAIPRLEGAEERLDRPRHDPRVLAESLGQVAAVNRWLGARRALIRHLGPWIEGGVRTVLDVGTGSGDLPRAVASWAARRGHEVEITAVDAHPQIAAVASARTGFPVAVAEGASLPFPDGAFDVALLSMTLHHADGEGAVRMLRELARVSRGRILVGELHRARMHYAGARFLAATLWRTNELTRHDGPVSVLRGFTVGELRQMALAAGLSRPRVWRHFFYRLVLTAEA